MGTAEMTSSVLLIEAIDDWRDLQQELLTDLGFQVTLLPPNEDPVDFAARMVPHVIVIHLGPDQPYNSDFVDRFQANPITRNIPIIAVTVSKSTAVQALAGANVGDTILAPFDIIALEAAVLSAVKHPRPGRIPGRRRGGRGSSAAGHRVRADSRPHRKVSARDVASTVGSRRLRAF